jgi:hypothetical protein
VVVIAAMQAAAIAGLVVALTLILLWRDCRYRKCLLKKSLLRDFLQQVVVAWCSLLVQRIGFSQVLRKLNNGRGWQSMPDRGQPEWSRSGPDQSVGTFPIPVRSRAKRLRARWTATAQEWQQGDDTPG